MNYRGGVDNAGKSCPNLANGEIKLLPSSLFTRHQRIYQGDPSFLVTLPRATPSGIRG